MLARRVGGRQRVTLTEFASGNMFGPVPSLYALAQLGVREVRADTNESYVVTRALAFSTPETMLVLSTMPYAHAE